MKKVLFVHPLVGNAFEVYKALDMCPGINVSVLEESQKTYNFFDKVKFKLKIPSDIHSYNNQLKKYNFEDIDIIFIIKGNEIFPWILQKIKKKFPQLKLINFSLDDMYAKHNRSFFYTYGLKYYDLVVTTKSYNIDELPLIGAKKVLFQYQAYSKNIHVPVQCSSKYQHNVVFIGYPEKERIESILFLAKNDICVNIYGYPSAWKKHISRVEHKNIVFHSESLYGKNYAEALSCAKISLCFLRKINRDLHTSRSIEIPACKGFMIAERTQEHLELFVEDEEAVYFENNEELLKKVKYYLENEVKREQVRDSGYIRCKKSGYSYDDRVQEIIEEVGKL